MATVTIYPLGFLVIALAINLLILIFYTIGFSNGWLARDKREKNKFDFETKTPTP